jgi:hypothetical protein
MLCVFPVLLSFKLFQVWPLGALSDWLLCLFDMFPSFLFIVYLEHIFFWHHEMF